MADRWFLRRDIVLTIALMVGSVGCAGPAPTQPAQSAELTAGPPVLAGAVTCGGDLTFAADLLFAEGHAETDPDPGGEALRLILAGPDGAGMPATGWVRAAETPGSIRFIARAVEPNEWMAADLFKRDGAWQVSSVGRCLPQPAAQTGTSIASFWLDPAFERPAAGDTGVHGLIHEQACASGKPPIGRVLEPQVFEGDTWVVVLVTVANVPGGADCQGNPSFPITVTLPSPLGDRGLFDGSVVPPRDATVPAP